jgi:hypothetical protein
MYITDSRGLETDLRWFPLSVPIKTKKKRSRPQLDRSPGDRFPNHLLTPRTKAVSSGQSSCSTVGAKWLAQPGLTNSTYSHPPSKTQWGLTGSGSASSSLDIHSLGISCGYTIVLNFVHAPLRSRSLTPLVLLCFTFHSNAAGRFDDAMRICYRDFNLRIAPMNITEVPPRDRPVFLFPPHLFF